MATGIERTGEGFCPHLHLCDSETQPGELRNAQLYPQGKSAPSGEASQPRLAMNYFVTEIEEMSKSRVIFSNLGTN